MEGLENKQYYTDDGTGRKFLYSNGERHYLKDLVEWQAFSVLEECGKRGRATKEVLDEAKILDSLAHALEVISLH